MKVLLYIFPIPIGRQSIFFTELELILLLIIIILSQGLIARGDHLGSLVEKDVEPPPIVVCRSDEQVTGFTQHRRGGGGGGEGRTEGLVPGTIKTPHSWHGSELKADTVVMRSAAFNGVHREEGGGVTAAAAFNGVKLEKGRHEKANGLSSHSGATLAGRNQAVNATELAQKLESSQLFNGQARWNGESSHKLRPSSISLPSGKMANGGGFATDGCEELKCPNCGQGFSYDLFGFDNWFDHIKYCGT